MIEITQNVLKVAKSYLGTRQGDGRHKDLINKYNAIKPLPVGYPMKYTDDWCAAFVTVIGDVTDTSQYIGRECGVHRFIQLFKQKGIWKGLVKPQPGDLIVFDWQKNGWSDHIGFVESFDGQMVTTIEGNTSRHVARKTYKWNEWRISGYARPKYPSGVNNPKYRQITNDLASEVIRGEWGNGDAREQRLTDAGYNYTAVQETVNRLINQRQNPLKTNQEVAREVIAGRWGNGDARRTRLTQEGYDYKRIQNIVNNLL